MTFDAENLISVRCGIPHYPEDESPIDQMSGAAKVALGEVVRTRHDVVDRLCGGDPVREAQLGSILINVAFQVEKARVERDKIWHKL